VRGRERATVKRENGEREMVAGVFFFWCIVEEGEE
jgi:hypothetical protein